MKDEMDLRKIVSDYIGRELADPEIVRAKRKFIKSHFETQLIFSPLTWALPAVAVALVFCFVLYPIFNSTTKSRKVAEIQFQKESNVPEAARPAATGIKVSPAASGPEEELPAVVVDSVESDAGQVMIYKQNYDDNPITIIWIFPGG